MNPLKRFLARTGRRLRRAARRTLGVAQNVLLSLLGKPTRRLPRILDSQSQLPPDAEYRKTFEFESDAVAYALEIPVETIVVAIYADDGIAVGTPQEADLIGYEVYIIYG